MGTQDRDWYREDARRRRREEQAAEEAAAKPARSETAEEAPPKPPKLWGENWHWTLQVIAWLAGAVLATAAIKLLGN